LAMVQKDNFRLMHTKIYVLLVLTCFLALQDPVAS
jgi:hypothetical protein